MNRPLEILDWAALDEAGRDAILRRPAQRDAASLLERARRIVEDVRARGDEALRAYSESLDRVRLESFDVTVEEFEHAEGALTQEQHAALRRAIDTVSRFHELQVPGPLRLETAPGVVCERMTVPLDAVGLYVPAGTAPLPSTAVMLAVPARIAGCPVRVMCTPPRPDGRADPAVLVAARLCGVERVFKLGGAQAVAAMAYGTATVPKVVKIFGPGNAWVTAAKQLVAQDADGAALDMPAGPSEVLVVADETARADFVAADLLAQAEHSPDAQVMLVTTSRAFAGSCVREVERQLAALPRRDVAARAIAESRVIVVADLETAMAVSNRYAPEHLILQVARPRALLASVRNAGSVFLGAWTPETMGDYCSGTNHVLPTYGHARAYSGLGVPDFVKRITVQELSPQGLATLGPTARTLARLESLDAHAHAVTVRLDALAAQAAS
ncbi:MAG TPA: histidinol dehydrogenase [Steroidobacteraceae bacterium]|nr:histidinol dehydrogenase [Steroidobacteraceae bacterium]